MKRSKDTNAVNVMVRSRLDGSDFSPSVCKNTNIVPNRMYVPDDMTLINNGLKGENEMILISNETLRFILDADD